jgi:hypothetical protein
VITYLDVGNVFPEVSNVTIQNNDSSLALIPNATKLVFCSALVTDYNGWDDVDHATGVFFDFAIQLTVQQTTTIFIILIHLVI